MAERRVPMELIQAVLWRRLDKPAFEHCRLMAYSEGYVLQGTVLMLVNDVPAQAHYAVHCGHDWVTRWAEVNVIEGLSGRRLQIRRKDDGGWLIDDRRIPELDGVFDVDLGVSPSTNTLPIRRLALQIGESRPADAAWVRFPTLTCERLTQRYTCVDRHHYRYESNGGAFRAELHVDDHGVVTRYGDLWERVTR